MESFCAQGGADATTNQTNASAPDAGQSAGAVPPLTEGGSAQAAAVHPAGAEAPAAVPPVTLAAAPLEDPYPRCTQLIQAYQAQANSQNKTPLAVLHEYAVRFNLEVWAPDSSSSCLHHMLASLLLL